MHTSEFALQDLHGDSNVVGSDNNMVEPNENHENEGLPDENHENEGLPDEDENLGLPDEDENLGLPGEDKTFDDVDALLQEPYVNVEASALVPVQDPPNVAREQTNFKTLWCANSLFFSLL